jgi:hypothetical protein
MQVSSSLGRAAGADEDAGAGEVAVPLTGGLATAVVAAAAVAVTDGVTTDETWVAGWGAGCSCGAGATTGAAVVAGVVVSWASDIAKKKLLVLFLGVSGREIDSNGRKKRVFPEKTGIQGNSGQICDG